MAILQGAQITGSIIATTFIKANGFSGSITASNLYVLGKAGIGTSSPSNTKLHIVGDWISGHSTVKVQGLTDNTTGYGFYNTVGSRLGYIAYTGTGFEWYNNESVPTIFYTNTSEKMRITAAGDVGIGTTSPGYKLDVTGEIRQTGNNFWFSSARIGGDGSGNIDINYNNGSSPSFTWYNGGTSALARITSTGNMGIGTTTPTYKLQVNGSFAATTKSFDIPHPTKENKRLVYASLEGPENGVYVRGKNKCSTIYLPDYWTGLVHEDSITVSITSIGKTRQNKIRNYSVTNIEDNMIQIFTDSEDEVYDFNYIVYAERKDVAKLVVEKESE